jgi:putative phosphoesterase
LAATEVVDLGGILFYVLHDLGELDLDPSAAGFAVVISGHTHRPRLERQNGILFLNPGSAGAPRFGRPVTLAVLEIDGSELSARIIELDN